jgi:hypothetical protein
MTARKNDKNPIIKKNGGKTKKKENDLKSIKIPNNKVGEMPFDKMPFDKMPFDKMPFDMVSEDSLIDYLMDGANMTDLLLTDEDKLDILNGPILDRAILNTAKNSNDLLDNVLDGYELKGAISNNMNKKLITNLVEIGKPDEVLEKALELLKDNQIKSFRNLIYENRNQIDQMIDGSYLINQACRYGRPEFVSFLIFMGCRVDNYDLAGLLPQHHAVLSGSPIIIDILAMFGADMNAGDNHGNTPLHHAVIIGDVEMIRTLFSYNVIPNQINNDILMPIDMTDDKNIIDLIKKLTNK